MQELSGDDFIAKIHAADSWQLSWVDGGHQLLLKTLEKMPGSNVLHESAVYGPDLLGMRHIDFVVFTTQIDNLLKGDMDAEPEFDATSNLRRKEASEREYSERKRRLWQDENSDGVLRDAGALGEVVRDHDGEEEG
jgi:hypothetical protein